MIAAARLAEQLGEGELAAALVEYVECVRIGWNLCGPEITEMLGGLPEAVGWFEYRGGAIGLTDGSAGVPPRRIEHFFILG